MTIRESLEEILTELRAIHALLEGPPPDDQPEEDRASAIAKIESAAELVRTGLLRRK